MTPSLPSVRHCHAPELGTFCARNCPPDRCAAPRPVSLADAIRPALPDGEPAFVDKPTAFRISVLAFALTLAACGVLQLVLRGSP